MNNELGFKKIEEVAENNIEETISNIISLSYKFGILNELYIEGFKHRPLEERIYVGKNIQNKLEEILHNDIKKINKFAEFYLKQKLEPIEYECFNTLSIIERIEYVDKNYKTHYNSCMNTMNCIGDSKILKRLGVVI